MALIICTINQVLVVISNLSLPSKGDRKVHIKGGTVVNADHVFEADVYCEAGIIQ